MKEQQNFYSNQPSNSNSLTILTSAVETPDSLSKPLIRSPKFNRKSDSNWRKRIPSPLTFQNQNHINFVSPKRQSQKQPSFSKNAQLQHFKQRFSSEQMHQQPEKCLMNSTSDTYKLLSERKEGKRYQNSANPFNEAQKHKCQKNAFLQYVQQLEQQNERLKKKLRDYQGIREFLIQRQSYIYDISQLNSRYLEEIAALHQKISKTTLQMQSLQQAWQEEKQKLKKQTQSLQLVCEHQRNQLISNQKQISLLKKQIKYLNKSDQKKQSLFRNHKQNIHQNKLYKSLPKQRTIKIEPHFYDITNSQKQENNKNQPKKISQKQRIPQSNKIECCLQNQKNNFSQMAVHQQRPFSGQPLEQPQSAIVKKLKQKLRYSQIQIDVLSKVKDETVKIKDQNEKLKGLNRKYLTRIQYFTKRLSKRADSDSSLQLSLTPEKRNVFN